MSVSAAPAHAVIEALGAAWTIHGLYPDPEQQPAFSRAIDGVRSNSGANVVLSVTASGFSLGVEELQTERKSAERLAQRLYVHGVEVLEITGRLDERDIVRLFDILSGDEADVAAAGGVKAALDREGVGGFGVVERAALEAGGAPVAAAEDRHESVRETLRQAADPREFAVELVTEGEGDPATIARLVHERYEVTVGLLADDDVDGRESAVQGFVESFFHFDPPIQDAVIEVFLSDQESGESRAFLDQFSGTELARMAPRLGGQGLGLLMDYARIVTDPEADGRSDDLLVLLENPDAIDAARSAVAQSMVERFDGLGRDVDSSFEIEMPDPKRFFFTVLEVFRSLLAVEERDDRFDRLLRIWSGKVQSAVRRGEMRRAELWVRAVQDNPTYDPERETVVEQAVAAVVDTDLMKDLIAYRRSHDDVRSLDRLLDVCVAHAASPLVSLFETEDRTSRRFATDFLTRVAARRPDAVIGEIDGAPWYSVRNLVIALRRAGCEEASDAVRRLLDHDDPRVRTEAVRAVAVLGGDGAIGLVADSLTDEEAAVRSTALTVLGTHGGQDAEEILVQAVSATRLTAEQRERAITLLGRDPTPATRDLLERLANRRFAVTGTARSIRDAARRALADGNTSEIGGAAT